MRELDQLLVAYLDTHYEHAADADKQAFCALLQLSDPELVSYLLSHQKPDPALQRVVDVILGRTQT